jgi:hypothetical protein
MKVRLVGGSHHGTRTYIDGVPYVTQKIYRPKFLLDDIVFMAPKSSAEVSRFVYDHVKWEGSKLMDKDGCMVLLSSDLKPFESKTIRKIIEENERFKISNR